MQVALEQALAQRTAGVVAHARHRAEHAVVVAQRDLRPADEDLLQRSLPQVGHGAQVLPVGVAQLAGATRRSAARKLSGSAGLTSRA